MVIIASVKPNANKTRYTLTVESHLGANDYSVSADTYLSLGSPDYGSEISEREFSNIRLEDEGHRAFKKAYNYLADMDRSRYALKVKLMQAGFSSDASDIALERCNELGYLNEYEQVERAVEREANYKLRGRYYIKRRLSDKGYSLSDINRAIADLTERGDVDFDENFERLVEKKGALTEEEITKLKYRFGYKI